MTKQNEKKRKGGQAVRASKASAAARTGESKVKTAVTTKPLLEMKTEGKPAPVPAPTSKAALVPQQIRRRQFLLAGAGLAATTAALGGWLWWMTPHPKAVPPRVILTNRGDQLVVRWNTATLDALHNQQAPLPVAARALSIVNTCMFDAWAAYDPVAVGTRLGAALRQPDSERTQENKARAISYAAYRALVDLFPAEQTRFQHLMTSMKYNPADTSTRTSTPAGVGNRAAQAALDFRHTDGSNQLGDLTPHSLADIFLHKTTQLGTLSPGSYADYTHYRPYNTPEELKHPDHWQPLSQPVGRTAVMKVQQFACAHWANVTPFAIASALQFVPKPGMPQINDALYTDQAMQLLRFSANLTELQKVIAEYWISGSEEQILARWFTFARFLSERDDHSLDQNIKMYFSLANAALDTSIACWATKRAYDSPYPVTAVRYLFKGKQIHAWAGPGKYLQWFNGQYWQPYQPARAIAPAYPEYCSEQSAFSAASAEIMRCFTGHDTLGTSDTRPAHSSEVENDVPALPVTLSWPTFSQAVEQAGLAGCYSGTHFPKSDADGRALGRQVAAQVWQRAQGYITGKPAII